MEATFPDDVGDRPDNMQASEEDGGGQRPKSGATLLSGTGLSSDSEDSAEGDINSADENEGGEATREAVPASAMKDLFGDDEDDDDEDDDDYDNAGKETEGATRTEASAGRGEGAGGGAVSDDDDVFGEGGGVQSSGGVTKTLDSDDDDDDILGRRAGGGALSDEEPVVPKLPDRDLQIAVLTRPALGADVMSSRLPNILGVKTEAFSSDNYDEEAEADEFKFTTNIMRWRHKLDNRGRVEMGEDGRPLRETNTRLVKWSDGSMQLLVGDEAFDVGEHSTDRSALFVQQRTREGSVLQCQGELTKKISFKPSNVLSKAHRTLTLAVRKRAVKGSRIIKYAETVDPEQVKQERARAEEALHKQVRRRNRVYDKYGEGGQSRRPNMDIDYLEEGAYDGTSLKDIKSRSRAGRYDRIDNMSDNDDDSDEDTGGGLAELRAKRAAAAAASKEAGTSSDKSSEVDDEEDSDEEDEDDDGGTNGGESTKSSPIGKKRQSPDHSEGDEEDEEEDSEYDEPAGAGKGKRRRAEAENEEEEDEDSDAGATSAAAASTPAKAKRMHRSIVEDSDSD